MGKGNYSKGRFVCMGRKEGKSIHLLEGGWTWERLEKKKKRSSGNG